MNMCTREKEKFWQPAPLSHHTPSLRIHKYTFDTQVNSQNTRHSNRPQHSNQQKKNAEAKQKLEMAHWTRMFFLPSENWMVNKKKTLQQKKKTKKNRTYRNSKSKLGTLRGHTHQKILNTPSLCFLLYISILFDVVRKMSNRDLCTPSVQYYFNFFFLCSICLPIPNFATI